MVIVPLFFIHKLNNFKFHKTQTPIIKDALRQSLFLSFVPIIFIIFGGLHYLYGAKIHQKLVSLGILDHFFYVAISLSFINAFIEEWYFRHFLTYFFPKNWTNFKSSLIGGIIFIPHHFLILIVYFPLPVAILFSIGTGVAGAYWTWRKLQGSSLTSLFISHIVCDLVVILWAGSLLLNQV